MEARLKEALGIAVAKVEKIDFSLQKKKMVDVVGWSAEAVEVMERQYRRFLAISSALQQIGSEVEIVPNRPIDEFWHAHIMDTEKYHADCLLVFQAYFHHFPYFGIRDADDTECWGRAAQVGNDLWHQVFGESLHGDPGGDAYELDRKWVGELSAAIISGKAQQAMQCKRTACKPQKCR